MNFTQASNPNASLYNQSVLDSNLNSNETYFAKLTG
jgi:hypothetical protein